MKKISVATVLVCLCALAAAGQSLTFNGQTFELKNVTGSITEFQGEKVLKIERDLKALAFDATRLEATVDEPTYAKLANVDFEDGTIEVKMYSQIQNPSPFQFAQGFIGLAFRADENDRAFESIYLRPKVGRSDNQAFRNKAVQYYAYPDHKFETLRKKASGKYEGSAPVNIHEWIALRVEVNGKKAELFVNDAKYSTFVVDSMLGRTTHGAIGLWVDIGTIGYFKDLKVTPRQNPVKDLLKNKDHALKLGQQGLRSAFQSPTLVHKIPYGNNPAAGHYVQAKDARIYYEVYGKGQPIVLLHGGILGSTIEMSDFIDSLKSNFQVIAISTRGHGKSEMGSTPITYEQKAEDVMAVVNAVTSEDVLILGFSDGAYGGYKVASMYPERIKKMIAIGAGEQIPGLRRVDFDAASLLKLDEAYWQQQFALMPQPERLPELCVKMQYFYNAMTASKELFGSIKCPVLVMSGELDRNAPLPTIINAYNMIPKSQLCIIPNAGHVVFSENFAAVWASIVPFLRD